MPTMFLIASFYIGNKIGYAMSFLCNNRYFTMCRKSSMNIVKNGKGRKVYGINTRIVLAFRELGKVYTADFRILIVV